MQKDKKKKKKNVSVKLLKLLHHKHICVTADLKKKKNGPVLLQLQKKRVLSTHDALVPANY